MDNIFNNLKTKIEKEVKVGMLMGMAESFAEGLDWKSNGIANDTIFGYMAEALPDCELDQTNTVMYHLKSHLESMMELAGDDSLDMDTLSYQGIMDYIRQHQKKVADSQHTYRVIRDLFEMSLKK